MMRFTNMAQTIKLPGWLIEDVEVTLPRNKTYYIYYEDGREISFYCAQDLTTLQHC